MAKTQAVGIILIAIMIVSLVTIFSQTVTTEALPETVKVLIYQTGATYYAKDSTGIFTQGTNRTLIEETAQNHITNGTIQTLNIGWDIANLPVKANVIVEEHLGTNTTIRNNQKYNPVGYVSAPIGTGVVLDSGGSATWANATVYVVTQSDKDFYYSTTNLLYVKINGVQLTTACGYCSVPSGKTIEFAYSDSATWTDKVQTFAR